VVAWQNWDMTDRTRGYAYRIDVTAPAVVAWEALTTSAALNRWCSAGAEIDAREGGSFRANVDRVTEFEAHIDVFRPQRRMRLIHLRSPALPPTDSTLIDDFVLDASAERTIVRLLGSGIPSGSDWDTIYLRQRTGWERAMARLKVLIDSEAARST
jgi:uncharacterized protein YndB with AHSA1/START domain